MTNNPVISMEKCLILSHISYDAMLTKSSVTEQVLQLYTLNYWRPQGLF